eukprot:scpid27327/ scgid32451/ 
MAGGSGVFFTKSKSSSVPLSAATLPRLYVRATGRVESKSVISANNYELLHFSGGWKRVKQIEHRHEGPRNDSHRRDSSQHKTNKHIRENFPLHVSFKISTMRCQW